MSQLGVWQVGEQGPERVKPTAIGLETHLESWIENDPDLVETGLRIVGRQVRVAGGVLDLLAVDPQGRWVVIEIKKGRLYRETLAQALDYASCIASMPAEELQEIVRNYLNERGREEDIVSELEEEEREVRVCVVGLSRDPSLDRVAEFLARRYSVPIKVVTFESYKLASGERILLRELSEVEVAVTRPRKTMARSLEELLADAEANGIGREFRMLAYAAQRHGLYLRPWKWTLMITPQANRTRMLYAIETRPDKAGRLLGWISAEAFAEFFPGLTEEEVVKELGPSRRLVLTAEEVERFVAGLDRLFAKAHRSEVEENQERQA